MKKRARIRKNSKGKDRKDKWSSARAETLPLDGATEVSLKPLKQQLGQPYDHRWERQQRGKQTITDTSRFPLQRQWQGCRQPPLLQPEASESICASTKRRTVTAAHRFLHNGIQRQKKLCERMWAWSVVSDSATPWTVAHHAPLSMGYSRQEYGSGCHFLLQGIFPTQGSNWHLLHCRRILYHWAIWKAPKAVYI